jgi:cytochrome P450
MFGDGILTQEGDIWKHSRKMLRPQLHHDQYEDLSVFQPAVDDLIDRLHSVKGVVDLQPLFFRLTLDTTTAFLFGESVRCLNDDDSVEERSFANAFDTAQRWVTKRFRLLDFYWIVDGREFHKACKEVHDFANQLLDRNLSSGKREEGSLKKYSFLDAVAKSTSDRTALRGQIINLIAGGRDTTACLLSWTL